MSSKLNFVPFIPNYEWIINEMKRDLEYRKANRLTRTSLGIPYYYNINVQLILTQECPYNCPFCLERENPMEGNMNFRAQISSLKKILKEHPTARLTITGGEPSLYPKQIEKIVSVFRKKSKNKFISLNTAGYNPISIEDVVINLSVNDYVKPDLSLFHGATYQTVLNNEDMNIKNLRLIMNNINNKTQNQINKFSFRYLTEMNSQKYNIQIFNDINSAEDFEVKTFRIGDFFTYLVFNYKGNHGRITIGDMKQQRENDYGCGYSNIIIHPDGNIGLNWR